MSDEIKCFNCGHLKEKHIDGKGSCMAIPATDLIKTGGMPEDGCVCPRFAAEKKK